MQRRNFLWVIVLLATFMAFPCFSQAAPITIDFDDLSDGTVVTNQYAGQGVVFSAHHYNSFFSDPDVVKGSYVSGGITMSSYCSAAAYFQADFSVAVDYVSVDLQPFEQGQFYLGIEIYDATDTLLGQNVLTAGSNSTWGSIDPNDMVSLSLASTMPNVSYARFFGYYGGEYGVNAISADNFTFNATPVPEPATMFLLGTGLLGFAGFRKKLKK